MTSEPPPPTNRPARSRAARQIILLLSIVAITGVIRLAWGYYTSRALRVQLADLRARGEPLEAADFPFAEIPDAENAAKYQQDAALAFVPNADPPRATNMVYAGYPPYGDAWMAAAEGSERAHGKVFALAREARRHTRARWNPKPLTAPLAVAAPVVGTLNAARHLTNILGDGAELAHARGDDVEAIERVRDILHLARSLRQDDTMIGQLVGTGIDALACYATLAIAPGLRLDATASTPAPAARAAVQGLIAELLDEGPIQQGVTRSLRFERAMTIGLRQADGKGAWVIRPLVDAQILRDNRNFDIQVAASRLSNKPQVMAALAKMTVEEPNGVARLLAPARSDVPRYSRWFGTASYTERYFETLFRVVGERRMAALALAAQLFRADHGRWPARLDELVPAYLPAVPLDPFTDGDTIGYKVLRGALPDGADRPLVFDRAGEVDVGPFPEPTYSWEHDRRKRPAGAKSQDIHQYRDLTRFVPPPPPASMQAVEDEP